MNIFTNPIFTQYIDISSIEYILELGTRDGVYTEDINRLYNPKIIYSIEANPYLKNTIIHNQKHINNSKFYSIALADYDGSIDFYLHPDGGSSSIYKHLHDETQKIHVDCLTLDNFCKIENIQRLDLICADVEGAEARIFKNSQILEQTKYIISEVKIEPSFKGYEFPGLNELKASLEPIGFEMIATHMPAEVFGDSLWVNKKLI
jgi:FkbM family methyltransferase